MKTETSEGRRELWEGFVKGDGRQRGNAHIALMLRVKLWTHVGPLNGQQQVCSSLLSNVKGRKGRVVRFFRGGKWHKYKEQHWGSARGQFIQLCWVQEAFTWLTFLCYCLSELIGFKLTFLNSPKFKIHKNWKPFMLRYSASHSQHLLLQTTKGVEVRVYTSVNPVFYASLFLLDSN